MSRVVVIADDPWIAWLVADELTDRGHQVTPVTQATAALRQLEGARPDVVVVDGTLGEDVLARCLTTTASSRTPIVVIAAAGSQPSGMPDGTVRRWLLGPVDLDALAACITQIAGTAPTAAVPLRV